ncbi:MAG: hypothetical protein ABSG41_18615 [Bryobacteraceae bacterium]|jgi:hypothetical protein
MRLFLALLLLSGAAFSQQPVAPPAMTDTEIVAVFNGISLHASKIEPMLQQLHPNDWVAKGAPDTYVVQWNSTLEQLRAIQSDMSALAQHPDQMTECMKALFRVQASHQALDSLMGGLRRYQNPALAELIESVAAEDQSQLDRLEQYVLELANAKDQQFAVVDREAQRCRATLSRQPVADPSKTNRRTQ